MTTADRTRFAADAAAVGAALDAAALDRFDRYLALLLAWNEQVNLTAITAPAEVLRKHFLDSLTLLPFVPAAARSAIDVGTGAGFPGVPLAIARPDLSLTLLDSLQKRLNFLKALGEALTLPFTCVHARAEEGGRRPELRGQFDLVTARAVAALPVLCEYCLPYARVGGRFIAMKGPACEAEVAAAETAVHRLGGRIAGVETFPLPGGDEPVRRTLVLIDKLAPTPDAYPRTTAKIAKQPL